MRRHPLRAKSARSLKPTVERVESRVLLATFIVTDTNDNSGMGSLRWAITQSNATPGSNTIDFDIASSGVQTIEPTSALPPITVPVTIDGTTEPGYDGTPLIQLDGSTAGKGVDGLDISAGDSTVLGLAINQFSYEGINLSVAGNDLIQEDFLGTDPTGTIAEGNDRDGLLIGGNSNTNTISGNVISGNTNNGIYLDGSNVGGNSSVTSGNLITDNLVGTDVTGMHDLANGEDGIFVLSAPMTTVGGTTAATRNIISGNDNANMELYEYSDDSVFEGNYIGTNILGTAPVTDPSRGAQDGITFRGISNSTIGGTATGAGNVISGDSDGITCFVLGSENLAIEGNLIGTDPTGTLPVGNTSNGVVISGPTGVTIGGTVAGAGNVISANQGEGIETYFNGAGLLIEGNKIGTDISGTLPMGNGYDGLQITYTGVTVGGLAAGAGNIIAFNGTLNRSAAGVEVTSDSVGTPVLSNSIFDNSTGIFLNNGNNGQVAPVLSSTMSNGNSITIPGSLTSAAGTYTLQFFSTPTLDAGGFAEGQTLLGTETLTTNGATTDFSYTFPTAVPDGDYITATATDSAGDTSEFSKGTVLGLMPPTIGVEASSQSVFAGQQVTDTFTITNAGMVNDAGVAFSDPIPAGTTFVSGSASTGGAVTLSGGSAIASFGTFAPGQSVTVSIVLTTSAAAEPSFTNTGGVTATTPLVASGADTASATTTVEPTIPAKPTIKVESSSQSVIAGQAVTDTFTITNPGTGADAGVVFSDSIPAGTTFVSGFTTTRVPVTLSGGVATANLATLTAGETVIVSIVLMTSTLAEPSFTNSGSMTATTPPVTSGTDIASVTTPVVPSADLGVAIAGPATTTPTGKLSFTATVTNAGPVAAMGSTLTDTFTLPTGATLSSEAVSQGTVSVSGDVVTASFGSIANAAMATLTVVVTTTVSGTFADSAVVTSTTADPNENNNSASTSVTVNGLATISLTPSSLMTTVGKAMTLSAQVSVPPGFVAATRSVTFYDGSTSLGTVTLNASGHASLVVTLHGAGKHSLSASYSGDPNYATATSTSATVRVGDAIYGDYDGDGKSDIAIYDQTNATFYILYSGGGSRVQQLGNVNHVNIPVVGDFDGDGKTDLAIYDQTAAEFYILYSNGGSLALPFGNAAHVNIPVAGDFDGDGKTDIAIYDQTAAEFFILDSKGGSLAQPFGSSRDTNIPVAGDFDGDGKSDIAIYDQTAATFYVLYSGGGSRVQQLGNVNQVNIPVVGDFDGDGRSDLTIYDQTNGYLYSLDSGGGASALLIGRTAQVDIPLSGDFDGDGKTDVGIYDETDGEFFVNLSAGGSLAQPFGNNKHANRPI